MIQHRFGPRAICAVFVLCAMIFPFSAFAQQAKPQKIGYLDMERVTRRSPAIRKMIDDAEGMLRERQKTIDEKTTNYQTLKNAFDAQQSILTEEQKETRRKELTALRSEIEDLNYQAEKALRQAQKDVMEPSVEIILATAEEVAKEKGYDLLLRSEVVIYGADSSDLTDAVIKKLEEKDLPSLKAALTSETLKMLPSSEDSATTATTTTITP
ncbi:MAG: OmpH family outer membrane protein [bacterium]